MCPKDGSLSKYLESRAEVERVLAGHGVPVTTLRAGLILGGDGASFQIMARLVQRLPIMVCPRWTNTRAQAVALRDVVQLINYVVAREEHYSCVHDVGAPEVVTYRELMAMTARALGKKRWFIPSRVLSPGLSRLWISLVTGAPRALVAPLVQSLKHEMVAGPSSLASEAGVRRTSMREAIEIAIADDRGTVPHAFRGARSGDGQPLVRSVQRMELPEGWTAEEAAMDYVRWLPHFLRWMLRVRRQGGEGFSFDVQGAEAILSRTAAIVPPLKLTLEVMVPLMRRVGEAWHAGQLKIPHEHIISGQLRSALGTLTQHVEPLVGSPRILVTTPPGHLHEFGAIIGAFLAASRGFEPIYLGPNTPFEDISDAATESGSALILLSIARECTPADQESLLAGFGSLSRNHEVWVGIPEGHQLTASTAQATVFHQYDELDRALLSYKSA